jgi:hypothetical protein
MMMVLSQAATCSAQLSDKGIFLAAKENCVYWAKIHFTFTEKHNWAPHTKIYNTITNKSYG